MGYRTATQAQRVEYKKLVPTKQSRAMSVEEWRGTWSGEDRDRYLAMYGRSTHVPHVYEGDRHVTLSSDEVGVVRAMLDLLRNTYAGEPVAELANDVMDTLTERRRYAEEHPTEEGQPWVAATGVPVDCTCAGCVHAREQLKFKPAATQRL